MYTDTDIKLDERLKEVFERFKERGLKLNKDKYPLGQKQVDVLGHLVTSEGIKPDRRKVEAVCATSCTSDLFWVHVDI